MVNLRSRHQKNLDEQMVKDFCAAFQEEALGQLVRKIESALSLRKGAKSLLIAGGVAANQRFRQLIQAKLSIPTYFPHLQYCSDNAAMIAALGYQHFRQAPTSDRFRDLGWDAFSRYQFDVSAG